MCGGQNLVTHILNLCGCLWQRKRGKVTRHFNKEIGSIKHSSFSNNMYDSDFQGYKFSGNLTFQAELSNKEYCGSIILKVRRRLIYFDRWRGKPSYWSSTRHCNMRAKRWLADWYTRQNVGTTSRQWSYNTTLSFLNSICTNRKLCFVQTGSCVWVELEAVFDVNWKLCLGRTGSCIWGKLEAVFGTNWLGDVFRSNCELCLDKTGICV